MRAHFTGTTVLIALAACRSGAPRAEPELELARFDVAGRCYAGSPVRGILPFGSAEELDIVPERALALRFGVEWLERDPGLVGEPVGSRARWIGAWKGEEPIQARVRLASEARVVRGAELDALDAAAAKGAFGRRRVSLDETRALIAGTTQAFELAGVRDRHKASLAVEAHRATDGSVEFALVFAGEVERATDDLLPAEKAARKAEREPWRELVVLEPESDARFALVCPAPFDGGEGRALRVEVAFVPPTAEHAQNVEAALAGARATEHAVHERSLRMEAPEERERERKSALESLALAPNRRAALVFLAGAARADLCGDLALVADDAVLEELVKALAGVGAEHVELARDGAALAWRLERGAWAFLAAKLGGDAPVPRELRGLLARHGGEVARTAGALEDVLAASVNAAELARRLVEENRAYLEDRDPAARVRAFDWLAARGLEPKDFDPLGPDAERRKALDASEEAPK